MKRSLRQPATVIASVFSAIALCMGLIACSTQTSTPRTITVTSSSKVSVAPDVAQISVTITSEGDDATLAKNAGEKPMKKVLAALEKLGVPKEEIQTTYTDLSPIWDESGETGRYQLRTTLSVGGLAIENVAPTIDACVEAGASEISGPVYYVDSYDECYREALASAIEQAQTEAEAIAQASGTNLGQIMSVSEGYQDASLAYTKSAANADEEMTLDAGGMAPIEPGTVDVTAEVTVSYAIR